MYFKVLGDPVPKERPRLGRGTTYTPAKTLAAEERIAWAYRQAYSDSPYGGPLRVEFEFYRATRQRCDLDNLVKTCLDALNGIAYVDDVQIEDLHAWKYHGVGIHAARTEVYLYPIR